ncbi:Pkinase-domain-containing protein [Ascobolus immersus RN42]|uniref:mitogen-activated protein kinase kinase n=1 Tax=Ascobolus immersus RN42 TaxID=1160509 RepID=A0A3N4HK40_ASCIM|nr:Pkinase-domain-containing protein [Ascobolus immersus RN42]
MGDSAKFGDRSMTRKNKKGLKLGPAPVQETPASLADKFETLELGAELKLDLRAEDLQVINELGAGNGGTVSKVMHKASKMVMARKVIRIEVEAEARRKIVRELHIMHDCNSPHIVSFYGAFLQEGNIIMCMEYMDCGSLDSIAKKVGPVRIDVLGKISEAVVEGLAYLYNEHRILHRDIKPSNILVNSKGQIKLCDFGVSGELSNSLANTFVGTQTYMAPERIIGTSYSVKSDVWSLGLTLLELAIGRFPFDAEDSAQGNKPNSGHMGILDLLQRIVNEPPPRLPENEAFPKALEDFIHSCLHKDPDARSSLSELQKKEFMRRSRATPVDIADWATEAMNVVPAPNPQRASIGPRAMPAQLARQAPSAPAHSRGSSRTGSVGGQGGVVPGHPPRSSSIVSTNAAPPRGSTARSSVSSVSSNSTRDAPRRAPSELHEQERRPSQGYESSSRTRQAYPDLHERESSSRERERRQVQREDSHERIRQPTYERTERAVQPAYERRESGRSERSDRERVERVQRTDSYERRDRERDARDAYERQQRPEYGVPAPREGYSRRQPVLATGERVDEGWEVLH